MIIAKQNEEASRELQEMRYQYGFVLRKRFGKSLPNSEKNLSNGTESPERVYEIYKANMVSVGRD